jgi:hypothetical protein
MKKDIDDSLAWQRATKDVLGDDSTTVRVIMVGDLLYFQQKYHTPFKDPRSEFSLGYSQPPIPVMSSDIPKPILLR